MGADEFEIKSFITCVSFAAAMATLA